jgi:hypothetical protein
LGRSTTIALFVAGIVAVVVAVDVLFFRGDVWEGLAANAGVVLVGGGFYFRFLHPA